MLSLIQIAALVFVIFAASRTILRAKDKKIRLRELFFWLCVWSILILVVFFPDTTSYVANVVGIGRGIDVVIYCSIGLLFYLVFRLYVKLEESEREITRVIRELAIMNKRKKK